jgi:hypothetical protein
MLVFVADFEPSQADLSLWMPSKPSLSGTIMKQDYRKRPLIAHRNRRGALLDLSDKFSSGFDPGCKANHIKDLRIFRVPCTKWILLDTNQL